MSYMTLGSLTRAIDHLVTAARKSGVMAWQRVAARECGVQVTPHLVTMTTGREVFLFEVMITDPRSGATCVGLFNERGESILRHSEDTKDGEGGEE